MKNISIIAILLYFSLIFPIDAKGGFGSVVIDGETYNQASVRPEFKVSKLAIALDVYFYFNSKGIKMDTWDFSDKSSIYKTLVDKIYYLKWGEPGDNFYFMFGSLPSVTLGQGILVGNYSNAIDYPSERRSGLDLEFRGYGFGFEAIYSDFKKIRPGLAGMRLSFSPIESLDFGVSYATDLDQYLGLPDSDEDGSPDVYDKWPDDKERHSQTIEDSLEIKVNEYDVLCPQEDQCPKTWDEYWGSKTKNIFLLSDGDRDPISGIGLDIVYKVTNWLNAYGQLAKLNRKYLDPEKLARDEETIYKDNGWGLSFPGMYADFGVFNLRAEYRYSKRGFNFGYWDRSYETTRAQVFIDGETKSVITKESLLYSYGQLKGFFVQFNSSLLNAINFDMSYQDMIGEKWDDGESAYIDGSNKSFSAVVSILPSFIPKLNNFEAFCQSKDVSNPFKLFKYFTSKDYILPKQYVSTIYGIRGAVEISGGVDLIYTQTTSFSVNLESGELEPVTSVNIETQMSF